MSARVHQLILASAGTGKTYRLTGQFLRLLFRGVEPSRILATTFTRKAAGEIQDRVLERLVDAAEDDGKCRELARAVELPDLSPADCRALLASLTRGIESLRVRTIDSFFVGLVKLFALDLGLPPNWRISDTGVDDRLRSDAIQDALAEAPEGEMIELLRELSGGEAARGVHRFLLDRTVRWRPAFLESSPGAWSRLQPCRDVPDEAFEAALADAERAELPRTKSGTPNKTFAKAWATLLAEARSGDWVGILIKGLGAKVLAGETSYSRAEIDEDLLAILEPLVQRACHRWMSDLCARNRAMHDLLGRFEAAYEARKRESGAYRFDDLPQALAPNGMRELPLDERELDLWFRLDGRIDHLLLDEFQDTSPIQWRILGRLASEIVAEGDGERSFFCVGDVKQSIYGFRQAEPRLLANLHRLLPGLEPEEMVRSYRSSGVVLDTVNAVFDDIAGNGSFGDETLGSYRRAAKRWQAGFRPHAPSEERPGAACVFEAASADEDRSTSERLLDLAVERVEALTAEAPEAEIGVLMRVNRFIPPLILRLKRRGIEASGEGGNELVDSAAVLTFASLLHLADHPGDGAAAFHVASSPFGEYVGLEQDAGPERSRELARELRRRLVEDGLGRVTAELATRVEHDERWSEWDRTRFAQLLDMAYAFEAGAGLRASDFVDHLRRERVEAPGGARVRVMTVHSAKGLEFDCVILPELDRPFVGRRDGPLTDRPEPGGPIECVSIAPRKELARVDGELARMVDETTERMVEDGLSNLYVAMTRAARRLELLVPSRSDRGAGKVPRMADFVLAALPSDEVAEAGGGGPIWRHAGCAPGAGWAEGLGRTPALEESPEEQGSELTFGESRSARGLARRSPSTEEGGARVRADRLLAPRTGSRRGSLVHAWLERLEWLEDFELDREELLSAGSALEPDRGAREAAYAELARALETPEIRRALSRASAAPPDAVFEVRREHRFSAILPGGEGEELWTGSIDRLVLARREGEVVAATVVDYKTDRVGESELAERVEFYRPQLEGYARVVAAQTGLEPAAVSKRLLFLSLGRILDLE